MESIMLIVLMIVIMYFMVIRPENKRKKKAQEMRDSLKKGDVVTSIGGIIGKIVSVTDNTIVVETSEDRVRIELAKWAVSSTGVQTGEQAVMGSKKKGKKDDEAKEEALPEEPVDSAAEEK